VIAGTKVADGYDGLGYLNLGSGRINNSVSKFRANFGLLYSNGGHTINLQAQYIPAIINDDETLFASSGSRNANIGDASGITTNGAVCTTPAPGAADLGQVPAGAGSGDFGTGAVGGIRGYCAAQNIRTEAGHKVKEWLNLDLIYRVELPADTSATLVVSNLTDNDPSFYRGIVPYNSAYGSPLGRTFKLGVTKRF
jgi:outer membrane receptor protein involved in Fe transport